jgi:hypothetical protein
MLLQLLNRSKIGMQHFEIVDASTGYSNAVEH